MEPAPSDRKGLLNRPPQLKRRCPTHFHSFTPSLNTQNLQCIFLMHHAKVPFWNREGIHSMWQQHSVFLFLRFLFRTIQRSLGCNITCIFNFSSSYIINSTIHVSNKPNHRNYISIDSRSNARVLPSYYYYLKGPHVRQAGVVRNFQIIFYFF